MKSSMRDYLEGFSDQEIQIVHGADWNLEIGALTELVAFSKCPRPLVFDRIPGYPADYRVATNLYVTEALQARALGLPVDRKGVALVQAWRQRMRQMTPTAPVAVRTGPVQENVVEGDEVDILALPIPFWHEGDGGRFAGTGDVVITRDPDEGWVNAAPYRCQVHDRQTLGILVVGGHHGGVMMQKYWDRGQAAPVVICLGQDPLLYGAACMPLPWGVSELDYAGGLQGGPLEVVVEPRTGLPVPAYAEIAVIGHVPPPNEQTREEGPFGECTGYYTGHGPAPVVQIDAIWHRNQPILQGSPTMHGSAMMHALGAHLVTSAAVWDAIEHQVPNLQGVYSLYQTCQMGSLVLVVAIRQSFSGHATQAGLAALSAYAGIRSNRAVIVVDEDVDPASWDEVLFAVTSRANWATDLNIIHGIPATPLDPGLDPMRRARGDFTSSTLVIDACRPYAGRQEFPRVNVISPKLRAQMEQKWATVLGQQ